MNLIVTPSAQNKSRGTLLCNAVSYDCAVGRGGVSAHKTEGDGATPVGIFPLREVFYRADRINLPTCSLMTKIIARHDGWCDASGDTNYNKFIRLPSAMSAENLWRDDRVYDVIVVMGYNDDPAIPGKGSAIFMHVATPDFAPTAGCVALTLPDLIAVIQSLSPDSTITIRAPSR